MDEEDFQVSSDWAGKEHQSGCKPLVAVWTEGATAGTWLRTGRRKGTQERLLLPVGKKSLGPRVLPNGKDACARKAAE